MKISRFAAFLLTPNMYFVPWVPKRTVLVAVRPFEHPRIADLLIKSDKNRSKWACSILGIRS
jgi:hypothetical protein